MSPTAKRRPPIPPRSLIRLTKYDRSMPAWRGKTGREFRIGYYSRKDGLDVIWLVDDDGLYCETIDHDALAKYFEVLRWSDETSLYGIGRRALGRRRKTRRAR